MKDINYSALTPLTFLERAGRYFSKKIAFDDLQGNYFTYEQLLSRSKSAAQFLLNNTEYSPSKVSVILDNCLAAFESHFFIPAAKSAIVNLNPTLSIDELLSQIRQSESEIIILSSDIFLKHEKKLLDLNLKIIICVSPYNKEIRHSNKRIINYSEIFKTHSLFESLDQYIEDENSLIGINYTSGTTGNPKGVMFTHRSAYLQALGQCILLNLNYNSNYYFMLPMYHGNGWFQIWANVAATSKIIIPNISDLKDMAKQMLEQKISHCSGSPRLLKNIYQLELLDKLRGLVIMTGGASPTPKLIDLSKQFDIKLIPQYGLNESCSTFAVTDFLPREDEELHNAFAQGVPAVHAGIGIKVVDENDKEIQKDGKSVGEILLRGNTVSSGYYRNNKETEKSFFNGWFRTGDIASVGPNGTLILKDRLKDVVFIDTPTGWLNVSTLEVERILLTHEFVIDVAVVGIEREQNELVAFVESNNDEFDVNDLKSFCEHKLSRYHIPRNYIRKKLPKTATGKVQKHILREMCEHI